MEKKKKKWPVIIGVIIVLIIIGSVGSSQSAKKIGETTGTNSNGTTAENGTSTSTEQSKFAVGDVVELNGVQVTLAGVTESEGSQFFEPADGNTFVICEFEINNQSEKEISVSSYMSFDAYCDDYAVTQSLTAVSSQSESGKNQLDGSVAPGKKMNGVIGYEVSSNWSKLEITYSPDYWGSKSMTFEATK